MSQRLFWFGKFILAVSLIFGCTLTIPVRVQPSPVIKADSVGFKTIGTIKVDGTIRKIAIEDSIAYVAADSNLLLVNINASQNPQIVGTVQLSALIYDFAVNTKYICLAVAESGLVILDKSAPSPKELGRYRQVSDIAYGVDVDGNLVYLLEHRGWMRILDFSNPADIKQVSCIKTGWYGGDIAVIKDFCYVSNLNEGLSVFDIASIKYPRKVSYFFTNGPLFRFLITGNHAFLLDCFEVTIVDISNPLSISETGYYVLQENIRDAFLQDGVLFVANREWGIWALEVGDLKNIREIGYYRTGEEVNSISIHNGVIYAGEKNCLRLLEFNRPDTSYVSHRKRPTREEWNEYLLNRDIASLITFLPKNIVKKELRKIAGADVKQLKEYLRLSIEQTPIDFVRRISCETGEATIETLNLHLNQSLFAIEFVDSNVCWLAGDKGIILNTTDGGITWQKIACDTNLCLNDIEVVDKNDIWFIGHRIDFFPSPLKMELYLGLFLSDKDNSLLICDTIYEFPGSRSGLVPGDIILKVNGKEVHKADELSSALAASVQEGRLCKLIISRGGKEFEITSELTSSPFYKKKKGKRERLVAFSPERCALLSRILHFNGKDLESTKLPTNVIPTSISVIDSENIWVVTSEFDDLYGDGDLFWGTYQRTKEKYRVFMACRALSSIFFIDPLHGWAVGRGRDIPFTGHGDTFTEPWQIFSTKDGGKSWSVQKTYLPISTALLSVCFRDSCRGWAVGELGTLLGTTDGGNSWFHFKSPLFENLRAIKFYNNIGCVVGDRGTILLTTNCGESWSLIRTVEKNLYDLDFQNEQTIWIVGEAGIILKLKL